jgi:fatty acid desaturase
MLIILAEKFVTIAALLCAITVGYLTIQHGDVSLGLMLLFGQAQSFIGHQTHNITHEAMHVAIHKKM